MFNELRGPEALTVRPPILSITDIPPNTYFSTLRSTEEMLDANQQPSYNDFSTRPGQRVGCDANGGYLIGGVYQIGSELRYIANGIMKLGMGTVDPREDFDRTINASSAGEWFEHVYPFSETNPEIIADRLKPLERATRLGAYFVAVCIDGTCVVMPARLEPTEQATESRKFWDMASERYKGYLGAKDTNDKLAAQAIITLDPGDDAYTDSKQLGVMDHFYQLGQMIVDVSPGDDRVVEVVEAGFDRGAPVRVARTVSAPYDATGNDTVFLSHI